MDALFQNQSRVQYMTQQARYTQVYKRLHIYTGIVENYFGLHVYYITRSKFGVSYCGVYITLHLCQISFSRSFIVWSLRFQSKRVPEACRKNKSRGKRQLDVVQTKKLTSLWKLIISLFMKAGTTRR